MRKHVLAHYKSCVTCAKQKVQKAQFEKQMGILAESFKALTTTLQNANNSFSAVNIDISKSALNASLLSDYDGKQPSKLGEWFTDIELAANQLGKKETKLHE